MFKQGWNQKLIWQYGTLGTFLLASAISGCGGQAYQAVPTGNPDVPVPTASSAPSPLISAATSFTPTESFSFTVTGANGTTPSWTSPTVYTDSILKIQISAGQAGQISANNYSNFTASYGCVEYTIGVYNSQGTIIGQSFSTGVLAVNGGDANCSGAATSWTQDLSQSVLTAGAGPVTIRILGTENDFDCLLYEQGYSGLMGPDNTLYCPVRPTYQTHTVTGTVGVQTNMGS